jgi:hypothetical protein
MRTLWAILIVMAPFVAGRAQVVISSDGSAPDPSAMLEVRANGAGALAPRMNTLQRNSIALPATGLLIYNTDCGSFQYYDGARWVSTLPANQPDMPDTISGPDTLCAGASGATYSVPAVSAASGYVWHLPPGSEILSGEGSHAIAIHFGSASGWITVEAVNDCFRSNKVKKWVEAVPAYPVTISITASANNVCGGIPVTFTAAVNNPNGAERLVWTVNGNQQGFGSAYTYTPAHGDEVACKVESLCNGGVPVVSNTIVMELGMTITHQAGAIAPVSKTVVYPTISGIPGEPGKCWTGRNLGAGRGPVASSDNSEEAAGWYWQFNRKQGYQYTTTRTPNTTWITGISEDSDWLPANDPCVNELGSNWRLPTRTEYLNIDNINGWTSWSGPWDSPLKFHAAGYLHYSNGAITNRGTNGVYWSSSQNNLTEGLYLSFSSVHSYIYNNVKTLGYSVRCLRDTCSLNLPPSAGIHSPGHSSMTWRWNPSPCASGYKWNTTNNYATAVDVGQTTSRTETSLSSATSYTRYVWSYDAFLNPSAQATTLTATTAASCAGFSKTHSAGAVAPATKTVTYGVVTNIAGEPTKCWITRNLGASQQATAVSDNTEASAGWYWQFNRKQGYQYTTSRTPNTTWITSINENSDWQTANDPCNLLLGAPWRLPTYTEWYNVDNTGGWTNWNGPWGSGLKLHAAGRLDYSNGMLYSRGSNGYYWSSAQYSTVIGWHLSFGSGGSQMYDSGYKANGFSVRCLRD